jgi:hypothetical protein
MHVYCNKYVYQNIEEYGVFVTSMNDKPLLSGGLGVE